MRTVAFKTFGCRLNQAETVAFEQAFAAAGFRRVRFGEPAEVVVVHSCVVTQTAENECLRQFGGRSVVSGRRCGWYSPVARRGGTAGAFAGGWRGSGGWSCAA